LGFDQLTQDLPVAKGAVPGTDVACLLELPLQVPGPVPPDPRQAPGPALPAQGRQQLRAITCLVTLEPAHQAARLAPAVAFHVAQVMPGVVIRFVKVDQVDHS